MHKKFILMLVENWKRVTNDKFLVKTAGGPWRS